jgi:hypothetical protein
MKKRKPKPAKRRSYLAEMVTHKPAVRFTDRKKRANKNACRGRYVPSEGR